MMPTETIRPGPSAAEQPPSEEPNLVRRLLRREPPACLVIVGIDRAQSPGTLIREVLRPLTVSARSRGVRLVLGFDGPLPGTKLPYEVALDPEPLAGDPSRSAAGVEVEAHVAELAAAEANAARLNSQNEGRFGQPPTLPRARAPSLRVRLAVARATEPNPVLAAIDAEAVAALDKIGSFSQKSRRMDEYLKELRGRLDSNRRLAARHFGAEDLPLADLHAQASQALLPAPIDLAAARMLVERYIAEVDRRIDEDEKEHGEV
jgi:hypothetical protein